MKETIILITAGLAMSACSSISPAGLLAVSRLDPLETAPENISVAVSVPDQMRLRDGDASLFLGYAPDQPAVAESVAVSVPLSVLDGTDGPRPANPDEAVYTFGFSDDAAETLGVTQKQIKSMKAQGIEGTGTLSVRVEGGCLTSGLENQLPVSTWIRTNPGDKFVPLTQKTDLFDVMSDESKPALINALKPC